MIGKSQQKLLITVCAICVLLTMDSCVTLFGKKQTIALNSNPQGASAYINGKYVGITPCSVKVKGASKSTVDIAFVKKGYRNEYVEATTSIRGLFFWNALCFYNFIFDMSCAYKYDETSFYATLKKNEPIEPYAPVTNYTPPKTIPSSGSSVSTMNYGTSSQIKTTTSTVRMPAKQIYQKYNSAVFVVITKSSRGAAQGSGFFISSNGIAVSNYHVFADNIKGKEDIILNDGRKYKVSEVLAYSKEDDYIVFKVNGSGFNYIPVTKRGCMVGDEVYAIGSPQGLDNTFSSGLVSQKRGTKVIQISVPIDHGSSGGALINEYGEVIGITSGGIDSSTANLNYARDIRCIFN